MRHLAAPLLIVAVWALTAAPPVSTAQPEPDTEVRAIIDKAVARTRWAEEQAYETRYRQSMTQRTRKYDGDGEVTEDETRVYLVEPYLGVPYSTLISKDGTPVEGGDLEKEKSRWREFVKALENPEDPGEDEEDDNEIAFDEELLSRYTATLDGIRELGGRPSYVLTFQPKPGKLPVRRRIDHALNKSRGEIWIDQQSYEVARVTFQLMDRVRIWGGLLGSVSDATGHIERRRVTEGVWLPSEVDIYSHVRVLFSTNRRGETTQWSQFEPVAD